MDELLPVVDETGKVIGKEYRSILHKSPNLIHPVVHSWIFNSKGQVLLQQRSLLKDSSPGKWDMSCGGHIKYGSTADTTLHQELKEELGLVNSDYTFYFVETYLRKTQTQQELVYLYYIKLTRDIKENAFQLQKSEVEQVRWFFIEDVYHEILSGKMFATNSVFEQLPKIYRKIFLDYIEQAG